MVSTHSQQYITDFNSQPITNETGKSPLALLAKTCETIGLPDTPAKRSLEKKDHSPGEGKKSESPALSKRKDGSRSPRSTPRNALIEPSTSTGLGLPKQPFAGMPFTPMGFPMPYPGMMPYPHMPFPAFAMHPFMRSHADASLFGGKCPAALLNRPCITPGCTQCTPTSTPVSPVSSSSVSEAMAATVAAASAAAAAASFPSMMPQFAYPFLPTSSGASSLPASYQQMLQASAAAAMAQQAAATAASAPKHMCSWMDSPANGVCGKSFNSADDLANHVKVAHTTASSSTTTSPSTPSPVSSAAKSSPTTPSTGASTRYHPYIKPSTNHSIPTSLPMGAMPGMFPFPIPGMGFPASLQAMYTQRLMSTMQHP